MGNRSAQIVEAVKTLFEEAKVDLVIGFEKGTLPLRSTPCFIRNVRDAERLIWDSCCENNLAAYLPRRKERIAIVVKGCDSRSLVGLLQERQIERENLVIIGLPCSGIINRKKVEQKLAGRALISTEEEPEALVLKGHDFEDRVPLRDLLADNCTSCRHKNPVLYDILIGEQAEEQEGPGEFNEIMAFEEQSAGDRWDYFSTQTAKCIKCYACRNACPICYCQQCCVDSSQPQWFGKSIEQSDTQVFHVMRSFHTAGRCVDCGACVRACPMEVDLRFLNKKIEKDVRELFSFEAGIELDVSPPLTTYKQDDPEEFIK